MAYNGIKQLFKKIKLYPLARWFNRHLLNREELHTQQENIRFYRQFVKPGDLVFDVGANYGEKTRIFLKLGALVIAFEPQQDCLNELQHRCGKNKKLITRVEALSSKSGNANLFVRKHRGASGLLKEWESEVESVSKVSLVTLDEMIQVYGCPSYIKIDVEGYEFEVISGLHQRIPLISFEYHMKEEDIKKVFECLEYLNNLGEISLNLIPSNKMQFFYQQWIQLEQFRVSFPAEINNLEGYWYGDIFVKFENV